jgi:hypothetical protein
VSPIETVATTLLEVPAERTSEILFFVTIRGIVFSVEKRPQEKKNKEQVIKYIKKEKNFDINRTFAAATPICYGLNRKFINFL